MPVGFSEAGVRRGGCALGGGGGGGGVVPQRGLLVGDFRVSVLPQPGRGFVLRIGVWRLGDPGRQAELSEVFKARAQDSELSLTSSVDVCWTSLGDGLLRAAGQVCGISSSHPWRGRTWWWGGQVGGQLRGGADALGLGGRVAVGLRAIQPSVRPVVQYTRPGMGLGGLLSRK